MRRYLRLLEVPLVELARARDEIDPARIGLEREAQVERFRDIQDCRDPGGARRARPILEPAVAHTHEDDGRARPHLVAIEGGELERLDSRGDDDVHLDVAILALEHGRGLGVVLAAETQVVHLLGIDLDLARRILEESVAHPLFARDVDAIERVPVRRITTRHGGAACTAWAWPVAAAATSARQEPKEAADSIRKPREGAASLPEPEIARRPPALFQDAILRGSRGRTGPNQ